MEKKLVELFEEAKKAADAAEIDRGAAAAEESRCLDALNQLKDFPVSFQLLVSTQVGRGLRRLTKHPRKKIQAFASDLIESWKNILTNGSSNNKTSVRLVPANSETAKTEKLQKTTSLKVEKVSKAETVKVQKINRNGTPSSEKALRLETAMTEKKVHNVDFVCIEKDIAENIKLEKMNSEEKQASVTPPKLTSMLKCNDAMRDKVRELLCDALSKVSGEGDDDIQDEVNACNPIRVAVSVESVMFENWGRSNGVQKVKYRSIMFNLKDPKNSDFRRKVLLGHVKPERLVNMNAEEMASDQRQCENQKIKERALWKCERGGPLKATTDQFKCGRCGQRKTTYHQLQTRSADEPMTTFVTCVNCNNHWKFC